MNLLHRLGDSLKYFGVDIFRTPFLLKSYPRYWRDWNAWRTQVRQRGRDAFPAGRRHPCLSDWHYEAGGVKKHYFLQDLFVAQKIRRANPERHVDIGSRVDGFVGNVAAFREIELIDIRPMQKEIPNVRFRAADLAASDFALVNYTDSVSSLHVIEHIGLGRYGDPVDIDGHVKALAGIRRLLKPNGVFYLSVPIGPQRVEFNAHRVFAVQTLLDLTADDYDVVTFSYIDDQDSLHADVRLTPELISGNCGCDFGCGILELRKKGGNKA